MYKASTYNLSIKYGEKYFVYNTLSRAFIALPDDVWSKINAAKFSELHDAEKKSLLKTGIILSENIDEKWVMKEFLSRASQQNDSITVFLSMTSACNLNCQYCYQDYRKETGRRDVMTKENVDAICSFFEKSSCRNIGVVYFGGEPTLDSDILIYAIARINSLANKKVQNTLITNGYIISSDLIDAIKQYGNFLIQITLDGNRDLHNSLRTTLTKEPTFDRIVDNIQRFVDAVPKSVVVRINVSSANFEPYEETIEYLYKRFGNKIEIGLEAIFNGQKKENETNLTGTHDILSLYDYIHKKGYKNLPAIEFSPCVARIRNAMVIDECLNVYSCPASLYEKKVGRITSDGELIVTDNDWYEKLFYSKPCMETCVYGGLCGGGCSIYGNECRKHVFMKLVPFVISKKVEKYCKEKPCD